MRLSTRTILVLPVSAVVLVGLAFLLRYQVLFPSSEVLVSSQEWEAYDTNDEVTILRRRSGEILTIRWDTQSVQRPSSYWNQLGPLAFWYRDKGSLLGVRLNDRVKSDEESDFSFNGNSVTIHLHSLRNDQTVDFTATRLSGPHQL